MLTQSHKDHLYSTHVLALLQLPSLYISNCTASTRKIGWFFRAFFLTFMAKIITE
jgi:hypothetical protein